MTELQKKSLLIKLEHLHQKEQELKEDIRKAKESVKTTHEMDEFEFWIVTNKLEKYV